MLEGKVRKGERSRPFLSVIGACAGPSSSMPAGRTSFVYGFPLPLPFP
jgi:hypothetical protein